MSRPSRQRMIDAFLAADPRADGSFVAAIKSTGIYCRPSCRARKPKPENIVLFPSPAEARHEGYRACKRCHPDAVVPPLPDNVRRLAELARSAAGERVTDKMLTSLGIDPSTARRQFRRHFGATFQAYQRSFRLERASREVRTGRKVIDAQLAQGFESSSGFRRAFAKLFGQPPKDAAKGAYLCAGPIPTPLGTIVAIAGEAGLHAVEFLDRDSLAARLDRLRIATGLPILPAPHPLLQQLEQQLSEYFSGTRRDFNLPLVPLGSPWDQRVWQALFSIPYGGTRSYSEIAAQIGHDRARRAVGRSNGLNQLCLVIPCHRVIRADGSLCGYAGGAWRKQWLLDHESRNVARRR